MEEEENDRRKANIIIHGLQEPTAAEADDRKNEDCDRVQELLHQIACDDVSIHHITRLGAPPSSPDAKPRPVKLDLASSESRNKVLGRAKNLRTLTDMTWKSVFIHQDLTPKERELRRALVHELKARKLAGETNLIIVNGKIVPKRNDSY